jgi:hypothetical protein
MEYVTQLCFVTSFTNRLEFRKIQSVEINEHFWESQNINTTGFIALKRECWYRLYGHLEEYMNFV